MSKTIIIVDDHNLFSQSLKGLVNSFENFEVINVLKNGKEVVEYFTSGKPQPDILLLDIRMPLMDGLETMEYLKQNYIEQKVLALTMEHEEDTIIKMINLGCRGYLLKDIEPEELLLALNCVENNGFYMNHETSLAANNNSNKNKFQNLTPRERTFVTLACTEMTYKEIAGVMHVSPKTIDGYRESLFSKLDLKNRVGLVLYAVKNNLVEV